MDPLLGLARRIARIGAWFGGVLLIAAALLVGVEVVIRRAFSVSVGGTDELAGYALAISTTWALAFALLERAHIRIDSLYVHLPARLCALLDTAGLLLLIAFFGLITWYGYGVFQTSYALGARSLSPLGTPLLLPQLLWVLGLLMFLAIAVLLLVRALAALLAGDLATVHQLVGSRTVREEVAAELGEDSDPAAGPRP